MTTQHEIAKSNPSEHSAHDVHLDKTEVLFDAHGIDPNYAQGRLQPLQHDVSTKKPYKNPDGSNFTATDIAALREVLELEQSLAQAEIPRNKTEEFKGKTAQWALRATIAPAAHQRHLYSLGHKASSKILEVVDEYTTKSDQK